MISRIRLPLTLALLSVACGGETSGGDSTGEGAEPIEAAAAPAVAPTVGAIDTVIALANWVCGETGIATTFWDGVNPRVVIANNESIDNVPLVESEDGPLYRTADGSIEWQNSGESASWTRGTETLSCRLAAAGEVEF